MRTRGQTLDNQALHRPLQPCNKNHGYQLGEGRILASCRFSGKFVSDNRLNEPMSGNDRGNKGRSEDDADDVRLMRLIGRGETIALEELIEKHQALVAGTVARMLGSNSDVEDIAQQVFIRVWKSARRYVPRAKFTTWLLKITRNLVFNELRRAKRHAHVPLQTETGAEDPPLKDEAQSPPDASLLEAELQRKIEEAILQLPEAQRMALVLRRYEQLSYDQIAEVLDLSVPAVKSVLFRARTELRSRLSKYLVGPG
jgi:RNA polymerase sigma-70 factor (ECF subfamily)